MCAISSMSPVCCNYRVVVDSFYCMLRRGTGTDGEERQKVFELQVLDTNQRQERNSSNASYPAAFLSNLPGCAEEESPATPSPNLLLLCGT